MTQSLKRNSLIPDSITYGGVNEPELAYGDIKVQMGNLNLLTQKVERLAKIKPKVTGNERNTTFRKLDGRDNKYSV